MTRVLVPEKDLSQNTNTKTRSTPKQPDNLQRKSWVEGNAGLYQKYTNMHPTFSADSPSPHRPYLYVCQQFLLASPDVLKLLALLGGQVAGHCQGKESRITYNKWTYVIYLIYLSKTFLCCCPATQLWFPQVTKYKILHTHIYTTSIFKKNINRYTKNQGGGQ